MSDTCTLKIEWMRQSNVGLLLIFTTRCTNYNYYKDA